MTATSTSKIIVERRVWLRQGQGPVAVVFVENHWSRQHEGGNFVDGGCAGEPSCSRETQVLQQLSATERAGRAGIIHPGGRRLGNPGISSTFPRGRPAMGENSTWTSPPKRRRYRDPRR